MKRSIAMIWWLAAALAVGAAATMGAQGAGKAKGKAAAKTPAAAVDPAVQAAQAQEKTVNTEWNSREMARSATREIARSERNRAEDAIRNWRAAQDALTRASRAGKPSAQLETLKTDAQERLATVGAAAERLMADTLTANKASRDLFESEIQIRDQMAATRDMEIKVAQARSPQDSRQIAEWRTLRAMEIQHWAGVRKDTAEELAEQTGEAARIAREMAGIVSEADLKQRLERFAQEQSKEKAGAERIIVQAQQAVEAAAPEVYQLKMAMVGGLEPLDPAQWDHAKARHLLVRAGFGGTPQQVQKLHAMGLHKAVDHLVEFYRQPAGGRSFDPTPPLPADPLESKMKMTFLRGRVVGVDRRSVELNQQSQLRQWWLQRMVESPRPLQEKLALFWHGLFASQDSVVQNSYAMYRQNQFFREHAAGSYAALLYGIVHDPAMIRYLDNNKNAKGKPNENLAREILELFSMGVDQGYTEKDIIEAARALTGYNYDNATATYRFNYSQHDTTDKTIFGKKGPWTGDDLVRLILEQPATPRFITRRLIEYFAYSDPDPATVDRLSAVLLSGQYALEPVLKNLFLSREFYGPRAVGNQIKSPVELVVGLLRDMGTRPLACEESLGARTYIKGDGTDTSKAMPLTDYKAIDVAIQKMGMQLMEPPDVKGWRYGRSWISSQRLFLRYNAVADLIHAAGEQGVDVVGIVREGGCKTGEQAVDFLAKACLLRPLSDAKRKELIAHVGELPPGEQWDQKRQAVNERLRSLLVIMLCMPEYQMS